MPGIEPDRDLADNGKLSEEATDDFFSVKTGGRIEIRVALRKGISQETWQTVP